MNAPRSKIAIAGTEEATRVAIASPNPIQEKAATFSALTPPSQEAIAGDVEIASTSIPKTNQCGLFLPFPTPANPKYEIIGPQSTPDELVPQEALPALTQLLNHPDSVGLAAYVIGQESEGVFHNADQPMPLASVVKIINLIAYANAANDGRLDPAAWIPLEDIERSYLAGMDLGAHRRSLADLEERGLIAGNPPSSPLEEVPGMMIQYSSNAASDYIHLLIGQAGIEQTVTSLGLTSHTAPCPWVGQFLAMSNHERVGSDRDAYEYFIQDHNSYGQEVMRLTESFVSDPAYRRVENRDRSNRPSIQIQSQFFETFNAHASPRDYASLMAKILQNGLDSAYVNILVRRALEWPMIFPANQELFRLVGFKNGSLPGILTTVYYAERLEDGAQIVVALFYRNLPIPVYREWRQTIPHDELARWLLAEPNAINHLNQLLADR